MPKYVLHAYLEVYKFSYPFTYVFMFDLYNILSDRQVRDNYLYFLNNKFRLRNVYN